MELSENSDYIVMRGIKDVLNAKPSSVLDNVKKFEAVKDSLYSSISPTLLIKDCFRKWKKVSETMLSVSSRNISSLKSH